MAYIQQKNRGKSCSYKGFQQKGLIKPLMQEDKKPSYEDIMANNPNSPRNKYSNTSNEEFTINKGSGGVGKGNSGSRKIESTTYVSGSDGIPTRTNSSVSENEEYKPKTTRVPKPKNNAASGATNYSGVGLNKAPGSNQSFCTASKGGGCLKP